MKSVNEKLRALYFSKQASITKIKEEVETKNLDLDGPLLMYCWDEYYSIAKHKIFFIGQEPTGWVGDISNDIASLLDKYEKNDIIGKGTSPFWRFIYEFNGILNPELKDKTCFLWTDIAKYSAYDGPPWRPSEDNFNFIIDNLNLLPLEIVASLPDVVIFLSGPNYDNWIQRQFNNEVEFEQVLDSVPMKELACLKHPTLPLYSYRTYHPKSLSLNYKWNYLSLISCLIKGYDVKSLIENFKSELEVFEKNEYSMKLEISPNFGQPTTGFYLSWPGWDYFTIGFEFNVAWGEFFYGIHLNEPNLEWDKKASVIADLNNLKNGENSPEWWPWWNWVDNGRNWNENTFKKIENGELVKEIKYIVSEMISKLDRIDL